MIIINRQGYLQALQGLSGVSIELSASQSNTTSRQCATCVKFNFE